MYRRRGSLSLEDHVKSLTIFIAAALVVLAACRPVSAQSTFGAVIGVISDSTNSVLAGAEVTLTEVQTGVSRITTSRPNGTYEFLNLTQGIYDLEVSCRGFAPYKVEPFQMDARQTVRIDPLLQVAGYSETIRVTSVTPLINTETPTIGGATSNRELEELPFTFRIENTSPILSIQVIPEVQRGGRQFSLSGSLPFQNDVSVDGILTTSIRRNGIGDDAFNSFPSIESIQEIKVSAVNNTAEFAQLGDITTISRPGTNTFGASAFWNFNTTGLNANPNYFDKSIVPDHSVNHDFGARLGGPLARNRTFFFGTFERLDITRSQSNAATVASAAFRMGDFSSLELPLIDPATGQPFPGNIIPASRINPVAARLLKDFLPAPNDGNATHRYSIDAPEQSNQFDTRVDQNFRPGHTLFGRVSWKRLGPRADNRSFYTIAVSDNYAFSQSLLNEARSGFTANNQTFTSGVKGADLISSLGLRLLGSSLPAVTGTSTVDIAGLTTFGEAQEVPLTQDTWQIADNLTWARASHTVKTGIDVKRFHWTSPVYFNGADEFGVFRFNDSVQGGGTGHPFANFLLGLPSEVEQTQSGPSVNARATHYGVFLQDDWRANRRLTVSAGIRYDLHLPFQDRERNITNFLRDTPNGDVVVPDEASRAMAVPGFVESIGSSRILTAEEAGLPEALRRTDANNIAPRVGIAWRPQGDTRTVIRGGYGRYYTRMLGQIFYSLTAIHTSDNMTFANQYDPETRTYSIVWPNTFAGEPSRGATRVGTSNFVTANDPNFKDPQTDQWSLTAERELNRTNAVRVTYSGFRSTHLTMAPDLNQIQPNTIGFVNLPPEARPYPNWNRVDTRDNGGYQNYHDIVVQLRGNVPRIGLTHASSYKWAYSIDNIANRGDDEDFQIEVNTRTDDRFDPDYLRGRTTSIPDHRFVSNLIWNVPVGRGRALAANLPSFADAVAGGWTISTIVQAQSGQHLTAYYSSHCGSGTNCYGNEKADAVAGQHPNDGPKNLNEWFNIAAFTDRAFFSDGRPIFAGRFGNAQKGAIAGPGAWNVDIAAFKDIQLAGRSDFRLSVIVTNVFNHANWGRPDTDLTSENYGRITTLNDQFPLRTVVFGGRLTY